MDRETSADVSDIVFDHTVPPEQRSAWLRDKVKNPYCFQIGEVAVTLEFPEEAPSLQELFTSFMRRTQCTR